MINIVSDFPRNIKSNKLFIIKLYLRKFQLELVEVR